MEASTLLLTMFLTAKVVKLYIKTGLGKHLLKILLNALPAAKKKTPGTILRNDRKRAFTQRPKTASMPKTPFLPTT